MTKKNIDVFREQIEEDIDLIRSQYASQDSRLNKPGFALNYWILSRIFSMDEEVIPDHITEYKDKGIDCFVHHPENRELIIIQNKHYSENVSVQRKEVSDFLVSPLHALTSGTYERSPDLQRCFNSVKDNEEYNVKLYFFTTTDKKANEIESIIREFNKSQSKRTKCRVSASYFGISQIYDLYFGKNYQDEARFTYDLVFPFKGMSAAIREEYEVDANPSLYVFTPVSQVYNMLKAAEEKYYPLFDKNIREYLGRNPINNGIIRTLESESERRNFVYYNNGITIICKSFEANNQEAGVQKRTLKNPQIVNGCQTANSIKEVFKNLDATEIEQGYKNVHVLIKALAIKDRQEPHKTFYENVVKYTNTQNAINDKAFTSNEDRFYRIQEGFKDRGFLLLVKPSDLNTFKSRPKDEIRNLIQKAKKTIQKLDYSISKLDDICIPLEKLLQVFMALIRDGCFAFTKKYLVLKQDEEIFNSYTSRINDFLTFDDMIKLFCLYKRAENDRKKSDDKRTPTPYYVIGFLGYLIGERDHQNIKTSFGTIFGDREVCDEAYKYLVFLSNVYRSDFFAKNNRDYTLMIKDPIDEDILRKAIVNANFLQWKTIDKWAKSKGNNM